MILSRKTYSNKFTREMISTDNANKWVMDFKALMISPYSVC